VRSMCLQPDLRCTSSPENQQRESTTRGDGGRSSEASLDASAARISPTTFEPAPLSEASLTALVVDASQNWEVCDTIDKKDVNGEVYYLVD
jgi:hypothetical protein